MEEEKIPKQKPDTSFNRRLSVAKKLEGNMTTAVARIVYPPTPQVRGYINPKKLTKFFKKYTPLPPVITFKKMGFKKLFN